MPAGSPSGWCACWRVLGLFVVLGAGLSGCARHHKPAPVEDRSWRKPAVVRSQASQRKQKVSQGSRIILGPSYGTVVPQHVTVRKGETLYAICFRYNLELKKVAALNGLRPPYTIYPGQKLRLKGVPKKALPATARKRDGIKARSPDVTVRSNPKSASGQPAKKKASTPATGKQQKTPARAKKPALKNPSRWLWPAKGHLVSSFSASDPARKGIVIGGRPGDPVMATADGIVVYTGDALKAYGQLIIIKHSETYLSAYGYNRRSLVKEGQRVKQGQQIAEMGTSPAGKPGLRFEIRKNGQPVNPMSYLPRR